MNSFAERHAQVSSDPLEELIRRRQIWATCAGSSGLTLCPDAQIVPLITVNAAIEEIRASRRRGLRRFFQGWGVFAR